MGRDGENEERREEDGIADGETRGKSVRWRLRGRDMEGDSESAGQQVHSAAHCRAAQRKSGNPRPNPHSGKVNNQTGSPITAKLSAPMPISVVSDSQLAPPNSHTGRVLGDVLLIQVHP